MKTSIKTIFVILSILYLTTNELKAQEERTENKTVFSIETDPSTFALKGYAFHIRIKPASNEHLVIGAGTYALNLPSLMVDMNSENKSKGWKVRINSAYSMFGEYYLKNANKKWFVGLQVGVQNYKNTNNNISDKESKYSNLIVMPSIGYNWHPLKFPLYFKPWLGIGYATKISGNNVIEYLKYDISPILPFVTLHIGYTF